MHNRFEADYAYNGIVESCHARSRYFYSCYILRLTDAVARAPGGGYGLSIRLAVCHIQGAMRTAAKNDLLCFVKNTLQYISVHPRSHKF